MLLFQFLEEGGVLLCQACWVSSGSGFGVASFYRAFPSEWESWVQGSSLLLASHVKSRTPVTLTVC